MRRLVLGTLLVGLTSTFLVGDVTSLPTAPESLGPRTQTIGLESKSALTGAAAAMLRPTVVGDLQQVTFAPMETQDFTVAGLSWDSDAASEPAQVEVRLREDQGWSPWLPLEISDNGPDPGTKEYTDAQHVRATDPVATGGADALQVRLSVLQGEVPAGLEAVTIDPGTSVPGTLQEESVPLTGAQAAAGRPNIVTRGQWGADESLRGCVPSRASGLRAAAIHHTAGTNNYSASESAGIVRGIYAYHTSTLDWCDVGYNFLVDKYGTVFEGRFGGVEQAVIGAHAGGFNTGTVGISALGNYSTASAPGAMVNAMADVASWKLGLSGVSTQGRVTLTSAGGTSRYAAGTDVDLPTVFGHKDVGSTACPGTNLYAQLGAMRTRGALTPPAPAPISAGDAAFVRALYADMLGRTPSQSEVNGWAAQVPALGRSQVAAGFAGSMEYRKRSITSAYLDVLRRPADPAGLEGWYQDVAAGRVSLDDIRPSFLVSAEFYQQGGGTDSGWITLLYQRSLGRTPSNAEIDHWKKTLAATGRPAVVRSIHDSPESAGRRVDRAYQTWLGRSAGASERSYWTDTVVRQGDEAMRQAVMVSPEYYNRAGVR